MVHTPISLSEAQIQQFQEQGFLILDKFLELDLVDRIVERLDPLFATRFETGNYPDEWYGRPGLNIPNSTRQMSGMWHCDRTIASVTFSAEIARLNATLMGWSGGRLATDSCWIKPSGAPEVAFHRNNTYAACINPPSLVTCWIALSEATAQAGTLEYVPGSHLWHCTDQPRFLHAPKDDYRQPLWDAAKEAGVDSPTILAAEIPPGGCIFMHGDLWHGSGVNQTTDQTRRSFAVSTFPAHAQFQSEAKYGYIFSRYRRVTSVEMDESFFPILWTSDGYRSPLARDYCEDAIAV
ncbi:phytanoyl-CoA dioxygenase family protein [Oscillatoria sp. FACHB-1407]|uniref:phytanoyl-CoA dioxygenase family protein n=1 Tax=Oscillatoria sp. FACHB-1407 TaxID=2692847 RepID=UPI001687CE45|nr:phytanoyl-CoA dioxygenase family protein [Oscillatoria sp. FACHB-1407]MBD2462043.1 phytanoyl-CoA dioxygenase family protein [Oscillatoria sp. FACHB-1407]